MGTDLPGRPHLVSNDPEEWRLDKAIFSLRPTTAAGYGSEAAVEEVLERLVAEPLLLGPSLSLSADGRWSSTFQVEAKGVLAAVSVGAPRFSAAVRAPVERARVWLGEADDEPAKPATLTFRQPGGRSNS